MLFTNEQILNEIDKSLSCNHMTFKLMGYLGTVVKTYINNNPVCNDRYIKKQMSELCKQELYNRWNYYNMNHKSNTIPIGYYLAITEFTVKKHMDTVKFNKKRLLKIKKIRKLI